MRLNPGTFWTNWLPAKYRLVRLKRGPQRSRSKPGATGGIRVGLSMSNLPAVHRDTSIKSLSLFYLPPPHFHRLNFASRIYCLIQTVWNLGLIENIQKHS